MALSYVARVTRTPKWLGYGSSMCSVRDCGDEAVRVGLCIRHYTRLRRHGDPEGGEPARSREKMTDEERRAKRAAAATARRRARGVPERRPRNPDAGRDARLRRTYGITAAEYDALLDEQGGVCALCGGTNPHGNALAVDHDHATGRVRGLLCRSCNGALGWAEARGLDALREYVATPQG